MKEVVYLDGNSLLPETLVALGTGNHTIAVSPDASKRIQLARNFLEDIASRQIVYGVNTGFGSFANIRVQESDLANLQVNLIRSHAVGLGSPLALNRVRMLLALRINVLCKGHSGVRLETVNGMCDAFNKNCLPKIPEQGSVGASGDLCPLAHLALGIIGEGDMWDIEKNCWRSSAEVMKDRKCTPITLKAKEGLALINGTQFITALTSEALIKAEKLLKQAILVAAASHSSLSGSLVCYDERISRARLHQGQQEVAATLRAHLESKSEEPDNVKKEEDSRIDDDKSTSDDGQKQRVFKIAGGMVQDAYTLRCVPQVYGVIADTLKFVRGILEKELNAATDNPMIFVTENEKGEVLGDIISGGNFHAEYPAKAADYLAIAIAEMGNMSERRTYRMTTGSLSKLPSFLIPSDKSGLNSGFMIIQYTAAAIASENKVLVHPAASDTIPTSEGQEDHVSMGAYAARKVLTVVNNVERIVGIEMMTACQALDISGKAKADVMSVPVKKMYDAVREKYGVVFADVDRFFSPDMEKCVEILQKGELLDF